jgi:hypothetical protein
MISSESGVKLSKLWISKQLNMQTLSCHVGHSQNHTMMNIHMIIPTNVKNGGGGGTWGFFCVKKNKGYNYKTKNK